MRTRLIAILTIFLFCLYPSVVGADKNEKLTNALQKAMELFGEGKWEEAMSACKAALKIDPSHVRALAMRGGIHMVTGNKESARKDWSKALELCPKPAKDEDIVMYLCQQHAGLVVAHFEKLSQEAELSVEDIYNKAVADILVEDWDSAEKGFALVLEGNETLARAFYGRGVARHNLKNTEMAIQDYEKALSLDNTLRPALCNLLIAQGKTDQLDRVGTLLRNDQPLIPFEGCFWPKEGTLPGGKIAGHRGSTATFLGGTTGPLKMGNRFYQNLPGWRFVDGLIEWDNMPKS